MKLIKLLLILVFCVPLFSQKEDYFQEEKLLPGTISPEQSLEIAKQAGSVVAFDHNFVQIAPPVNGDAEYYAWVFIKYEEGATLYHVEWSGGTKKRGFCYFLDVYIGSRYKQPLKLGELHQGANWDDYAYKYNDTLAFESNAYDVNKEHNWMQRVAGLHAWYPENQIGRPLLVTGRWYYRGIRENRVTQ